MRPDGYRIVWHLPGHRDETQLLDGPGGSSVTYATLREAEEAAAWRYDSEATHEGGLSYYVAEYYLGARA